METYQRKFNGYRAVIVADGDGTSFNGFSFKWGDYLEHAERMVNVGNPAAAYSYMDEIRRDHAHLVQFSYLELPYNANIFTQTEDIAEQLPHGSGVDCDWTYDTRFLRDGRVKVVFNNSYHAMLENGMYDDWADFSVTLYFTVGGQLIQDKGGKVDFTLNFSGATAQYLNQKHQLREYLEEIIYWSLNEPLPSLDEIVGQAMGELDKLRQSLEE